MNDIDESGLFTSDFKIASFNDATRNFTYANGAMVYNQDGGTLDITTPPGGLTDVFGGFKNTELFGQTALFEKDGGAPSPNVDGNAALVIDSGSNAGNFWINIPSPADIGFSTDAAIGITVDGDFRGAVRYRSDNDVIGLTDDGINAAPTTGIFVTTVGDVEVNTSAASSNALFQIVGDPSASKPLFLVSSSSGKTILQASQNGNSSIGTSSALAELTIQNATSTQNALNILSSSAVSILSLGNGGLLAGSQLQFSSQTLSPAASTVGLSVLLPAAQTANALTVSRGGTANFVIDATSSVSIGTSTTANGRFAVYGTSSLPNQKVAVFGSSTGATLMSVDGAGHIALGGVVPSVSSCGSSPSVSGNDTVGTITVGSGVVTACTLTFAVARSATPRVVGCTANSALACGATAKSNSAVTFGFSATLGSGTFDYLIIGQ